MVQMTVEREKLVNISGANENEPKRAVYVDFF